MFGTSGVLRVFRLRIIMSGSGNGSDPFSVPVFRFSDLNFIMKLRNKHLEYKFQNLPAAMVTHDS